MNRLRAEYILGALLIFLSSRANDFSNGNLGFIIILLYSYFIFNNRKLELSKSFIVFSIFYVVFSFISYLVFQSEFEYLAYGELFVKILLSYIILKILKFKFFMIYVRVMVIMSIISLPLYILQNLFPHEMIRILSSVAKNIPFFCNISTSIQESSYLHINVFVYTLKSYVLFRNSGFMWEPGGFAALLSIALLLNIILNKFRLNRNSFILGITLLTTVSTMGYILLLIIIVFYIFSTSKGLIVYITIIPLLIFGSIKLSSLDFLMPKINYVYESSIHVAENIEQYKSRYKFKSLGRFGSIIIDLQSIQKNPLLGRGLRSKKFKDEVLGSFNMANGLSNYLARLGILGFSFFLFNLFKSFRSFKYYYGIRLWFFFPIIILAISFSNPILYTPLFLGFQFFWFSLGSKFYNKKTHEVIYNYSGS